MRFLNFLEKTLRNHSTWSIFQNSNVRLAILPSQQQKMFISGSGSNSLSKKRDSQLIDDLCDWHPIYRFPYIVHCRVFARAKLYMTGFITTILPAIVFNSADTISSSDVTTLCLMSGFSLTIMYGFGQMFRRLIGSIYVSPNEDLVRISHLTFFGNRSEKIIQSDDLLFLSDTNSNMNDIFLKLSALEEKPKDALYICLRYGGILDNEKFSKMFGNV